MPKLHFGSRGGVYTIKKGTKKYLKFGNDEIDEIDFDGVGFYDEEEGVYETYYLSNMNKLYNIIQDIDNNGYDKHNEEELFHNILGYPKPLDTKSISINYYKNIIDEEDNLKKKLSYIIFSDYIQTYYDQIMDILENNHNSFSRSI
jgi:hypothetical protein